MSFFDLLFPCCCPLSEEEETTPFNKVDYNYRRSNSQFPKQSGIFPSIEDNQPKIEDMIKKMLKNAKFTVIDPKELEHIVEDEDNFIAEGKFGAVYGGVWKGKKVAVKKMRTSQSDAVNIKEFLDEINLLSKLSAHPNVLTLYGACVTLPNLYIVSKLAVKGSLYDVLHVNCEKLTWKVKARMAAELSAAMLYLHYQQPPIVHRDLKSMNILVDEDYHIQVADFGLSRSKENTFVATLTTAGSPAWMAPEVLRGDPFNHKSDVYSYGVLLWELLVEELPWSDDQYSFGQIVGLVGFQGQRLLLPQNIADDCPDFFVDLIEDCWENKPFSRPDFADIFRKFHPYCDKETSVITMKFIESQSLSNKNLSDYPEVETSRMGFNIIGFSDSEEYDDDSYNNRNNNNNNDNY
eukprot:TRINITY_DN493_c0_g2_i1.p1 TRINITY_DN493_c0_g2~~TRINITY_DN493_c0_g2_i1.p1  ORF type:complete len:407 (+),score=133.88 TRINITY_DN493_c0_g2_i1:61-1281(+)